MSFERCFCGAEWNDVAESCVAGHSFGPEDRLRVERDDLRQRVTQLEGAFRGAEHRADEWMERAVKAQGEIDQLRAKVERYKAMVRQLYGVDTYTDGYGREGRSLVRDDDGRGAEDAAIELWNAMFPGELGTAQAQHGEEKKP